VWCSTKTTFNAYVSHRSQLQFQDEDHAVYISFHWVTTTWLRWEPQPVMLPLLCVFTASLKRIRWKLFEQEFGGTCRCHIVSMWKWFATSSVPTLCDRDHLIKDPIVRNKVAAKKKYLVPEFIKRGYTIICVDFSLSKYH